MEVSVTDVSKCVKYLNDAAMLYDALAKLRMQKCVCRSHMIRQLTDKLNKKVENEKARK